MITLLRNSGLGCKIDLSYFGVHGYADDLLLLFASRTELQAMVRICEKFAEKMNLKFSTNTNPDKSKTKCLVFSKIKNLKDNLVPITLNGNPLPWVDKVKHLGNVLDKDNNMKAECLTKHGTFIGKVNSLLQEFSYVDSDIMIRLIMIFASSFHGSSLWNLYSPEVTKIFSSWNVTIRNILRLPRTTHRYFIEALSNSSHPKTLLCSRLVKFWQSLKVSKKDSVRYLVNLVYNDRRTLTGRSVTNIAMDCRTERNDLNISAIKNLSYFQPPPGEQWRIPLVRELIDIRDEEIVVPGVSSEDVHQMIDEVCCN